MTTFLPQRIQALTTLPLITSRILLKADPTFAVPNYGHFPRPRLWSSLPRYTMNMKNASDFNLKCHESLWPHLLVPFVQKWSEMLTDLHWQRWWIMTLNKDDDDNCSFELSEFRQPQLSKAELYQTRPVLKVYFSCPLPDVKNLQLQQHEWYILPLQHPNLSWKVLPNWLVLIASCNPKLRSPGTTSSKIFTTGFCLKTYPLYVCAQER